MSLAVHPGEPSQQCVRCAACCRVGGSCALRSWWRDEEAERLPMGFTGSCELLTDLGECQVMVRARELGGPDYARDLLSLVGLSGRCDFPHLRDVTQGPAAHEGGWHE